MPRRIKEAFRSAAPPTIAMLIMVGVIVLTQRSEFDTRAGIFVLSGLTLVVFLTYFVLAISGFEASRAGVVSVPRIYSWFVVSAIVILVFGVLFNMLHVRL